MKEHRSDNRRLAKKRVQCLNEALCFEIRFFAKRQNVIVHRQKSDYKKKSTRKMID